MKSVVILGAGPAGLAAAQPLSAHNIKPLVIEKENAVGGLCRTLVRDGFRFDIGPHRWFTKDPELDRWFRELMEGELVQVIRFTEIFYKGKFVAYPVKFGNILRQSGLLETTMMGTSYLASRMKSVFRKQVPITMEQAYVAQFGTNLFRTFFKSYSEKIWGCPCNEISADWVEERTKGYSVFQVVRNALFNKHTENTGLVEVEEYLHPYLGYGRISERMAEEISNRGGEVLLNHQAVRIHCERNCVTGVTYIDSQGNEKYRGADIVISTIPLTQLIKLMNPPAPDETLNAARSLQFRDLITVNVMLRNKIDSKATWIYIQDESVPFARLAIPSNVSESLAPPGCSSVVLEWFCNIGDVVWSKTDEEIISIAVDHLARTLQMIQQEDVQNAFVFRAPKAYPVYTIDYHARVRQISDFVSQIHGLKIIGRGGTFHYHTSDHSIEMGHAVAKSILQEQQMLPM